jgi:hypothetical protein
MRLKFVFALLLLALLVLGAAFLLKQHRGSAATPPPVTESATPAPVVVSATPPPTPASISAAPPVSTNTSTPDQHEAAIDAETDRLQQWSMNDDPASLSNILADLTNPEKEIRKAAIEAAKQFGSTNAIPTLKAVAANMTDTDEQIDLLDAANFLSLPSFDFHGSGPAPPRTPEQRHGGNRNPQSTPGPNSPAAPNQ